MRTIQSHSEGLARRYFVGTLYPVPLFALLGIAILSVFFFAPVTVTLDGYSHLYGGEALRWMLAGQPALQSNFHYNSLLLPNWLCSLFLAAASKVVSSELALKLLLVLTGAALLAGIYFCIDVAPYNRRQRAELLIVLLPFALNAFLTAGFFGFMISSSMCFFVLGLLLRHGLSLPLRLQCIAAGLLLVAYFSNPLPVMLSFLFPCAYFVADSTIHWSGHRPHFAATLGRKALNLWPWLIPACLLPWFYFRLAKSANSDPYSLLSTMKLRILELAKDSLLSIAPSSSFGTLFIALLSIILAGVLLRPQKLFLRNRLRFATLAVLILFTTLLFLVVPDKVGEGSLIASRFLLDTAIFLVLIGVATGAFDAQLLTLSSLVAAAIVIAFVSEYFLVAKRMGPALAEVQSAMQTIPRNSRILILGYRMTPTCKGFPLLESTTPERHWALAGALKNELIVLNDYEAKTAQFPLQYVSSRYAGISNEVDLNSASKRAAWLNVLDGNPNADYVVSWGTPSGIVCSNPVDPPFTDQLQRSYDRVLSNQGASRVELWRKRAPVPQVEREWKQAKEMQNKDAPPRPL